MKKRTIALIMAAVMLVGVAVGGTIAWLTAKSEDVVNTFTVGDINITLTESDEDGTPYENSYKMVPGATIEKDPTVKVVPDSEAHWLFVKLTETENLDKFIDYHTSEGLIASGWTKLDSVSGEKEEVWYRSIDAATAKAGAAYPVLANNKVKVLDSVTKEMMNELTDSTMPKLTVTAYAIQSDNLTDTNGTVVDTAAAAWALIPKS